MTRINNLSTRIALTATLVLIFAGCYNQKKATLQHGKAVLVFPAIGADYCARVYPPRDTTITVHVSDSTKYKEIVEDLQGDLYISNQLIDSLVDALANGDTTCRKYAKVIIDLQKQLLTLKQKIITIPPVTTHEVVTNTVIDRAALDLCNIEKSKAIQLALDETAERKDWQAKAKKRFWIAAGLGTLIGLYLFFWIRKRFFAKK